MVFHSNEIAAVYISSKPDHCERKLERKLDRVNHIMELIRTIVPIALLILNCIILAKIFGLI